MNRTVAGAKEEEEKGRRASSDTVSDKRIDDWLSIAKEGLFPPLSHHDH